MTHIRKRPDALADESGAPGRKRGQEKFVSYPEYNDIPIDNQQGEQRFNRAVPLRIAAAPVIARLAQRYRISTLHAAVVTDLLGIGGRT